MMGGTGWFEFITDQATTHIAYVYEDGSIYFPEGPDVVDVTDFRLANARGKVYRLVRADDPVIAETDQHITVKGEDVAAIGLHIAVLKAERDDALAALERVRELHAPCFTEVVATVSDHGPVEVHPNSAEAIASRRYVCMTCALYPDWPCTEARILWSDAEIMRIIHGQEDTDRRLPLGDDDARAALHRVREVCDRMVRPHQETGDPTGPHLQPAADMIRAALEGEGTDGR